MVCVPCIFVGLAIVIWFKFLEPYLKPVYDRLCQIYPPFSAVGNQLSIWLGMIERFAAKMGIRMPESCPMPKKNIKKNEESKCPVGGDKNKLYPDLKSATNPEMDVHQRTVPSAPPPPSSEQ